MQENYNVFYTKVLLGGSIGSESIRSIRELKGISFTTGLKFETSFTTGLKFATRDSCKESCKISNKNLSKGEKEYYKLKWVCAEVVNGKYTGN